MTACNVAKSSGRITFQSLSFLIRQQHSNHLITVPSCGFQDTHFFFFPASSLFLHPSFYLVLFFLTLTLEGSHSLSLDLSNCTHSLGDLIYLQGLKTILSSPEYPTACLVLRSDVQGASHTQLPMVSHISVNGGSTPPLAYAKTLGSSFSPLLLIPHLVQE